MRFSDQNFVCSSHFPLQATSFSIQSLRIKKGEDKKLRSSSICNFFQPCPFFFLKKIYKHIYYNNLIEFLYLTCYPQQLQEPIIGSAQTNKKTR